MATPSTTYKSVAAYARGRFRIIDDKNEVFFFAGAVPENVGEETPLASGVSETLLHLLQRLEVKMDQLLALGQEHHLANDFPCLLQAYQIGGNGIMFQSKTELALNMRLEVVLFLSNMPLRIAGGIGQIEGSQPSAYGNLWRLSFTRLRETDLDVIMRFVFQEERQKIREIKLA